MEEVNSHDQPKRRMPKTARTVLWEDGGWADTNKRVLLKK
jgi:hypothetical protein